MPRFRLTKTKLISKKKKEKKKHFKNYKENGSEIKIGMKGEIKFKLQKQTYDIWLFLQLWANFLSN